MEHSMRNKQNNVSDNRGITLIEVLVSIAIMGIVSSMISAIMLGGTNFFRKQSATIDLQNESQIITASISAAILEGTDFTIEKEKMMDGRRVVYFSTGTPAAEGANKAVGKQYIWVYESPYGDEGFLYIYDAGAVIDYNRGNCISEVVRSFNVGFTGTKTDESGEKVFTRDSAINIELTLANSKDELTQSIAVKPRNTVVNFNTN